MNQGSQVSKQLEPTHQINGKGMLEHIGKVHEETGKEKREI